MRFAIIDEGIVTNVVLADQDFGANQGWIEASSEVAPGWSWDGEMFAAPEIALADAKEVLRTLIEARRDQCFAEGFTPSAGPLAGKTLQVRSIEDRTNWLTSQAAYGAAVAAGAGAVEEAAFRTADNETIVMSYADGFAALLAMAAWGKSVMGNSWTLKDAVADAGDNEALDLIDLEAGWP